jgi:hypothetical protein
MLAGHHQAAALRIVVPGVAAVVGRHLDRQVVIGGRATGGWVLGRVGHGSLLGAGQVTSR